MAEPTRRSHLYAQWDPSEMPRPRLRWEWDGPDFSYIVVELSATWSDAVVGVTWELPSSLSQRIFRWDWAGRHIWGDHMLRFFAALLLLVTALVVVAVRA